MPNCKADQVLGRTYRNPFLGSLYSSWTSTKETIKAISSLTIKSFILNTPSLPMPPPGVLITALCPDSLYYTAEWHFLNLSNLQVYSYSQYWPKLFH